MCKLDSGSSSTCPLSTENNSVPPEVNTLQYVYRKQVDMSKTTYFSLLTKVAILCPDRFKWLYKVHEKVYKPLRYLRYVQLCIASSSKKEGGQSDYLIETWRYGKIIQWPSLAGGQFCIISVEFDSFENDKWGSEPNRTLEPRTFLYRRNWIPEPCL